MKIDEKNKHCIDYAWGRLTYYAPAAERPHHIVACGHRDPRCTLIEMECNGHARLEFDLKSKKPEVLARLERIISALDQAVDIGIAIGKRQVRAALGIES